MGLRALLLQNERGEKKNTKMKGGKKVFFFPFIFSFSRLSFFHLPPFHFFRPFHFKGQNERGGGKNTCDTRGLACSLFFKKKARRPEILMGFPVRPMRTCLPSVLSVPTNGMISWSDIEGVLILNIEVLIFKVFSHRAVELRSRIALQHAHTCILLLVWHTCSRIGLQHAHIRHDLVIWLKKKGNGALARPELTVERLFLRIIFLFGRICTCWDRVENELEIV